MHCAGGDFCASTGCQRAAFSALCARPQVDVVLDGLLDDDAGVSLGDAVAAACPTVTLTLVAAHTDAGIVDGHGRPQIGDALLIAAGGPYVQPLVAYLEGATTPVYYSGNSQGDGFAMRDGGALATAPTGVVGLHHDYFVVEVVVDPTSGSLALLTYGFGQWGTAAGAWFAENRILPTLSSETGVWYVVEWTDGNGDRQPDASDTFAILGSG